MIPFIALAQLGMSGYQMYKSQEAARKLANQPVPTLAEDPIVQANRLQAQQAAKRGFSQEEIANHRAIQSVLANTRYSKAINTGGFNSAAGAMAGINYGNIQAANTFAGQDASLKRQNQRYADSFGQNLQSIRNRNTDNAYNYRMMAERALGNATKAGSENGMSALAMIEASRNMELDRNNNLKIAQATEKVPIPMTQNSQIGMSGYGTSPNYTTNAYSNWGGGGGSPKSYGSYSNYGTGVSNGSEDC